MRKPSAHCNAQQIELFEEIEYAHCKPSIEGALLSAHPSYGDLLIWQDRLLICSTSSEEDLMI